MIDAMQQSNRLKTGQKVIIKHVLEKSTLNKLNQIANKLNCTESRPIYIAKEEALGSSPLERYKSAGVNTILNKAAPIIEATIGKKWLILTNKVLIRRTWPISEEESRKLGHNASNLTWHQDSNFKHGASPMVVLMAFLQDDAGRTRPGLSILEAPTNEFEGIFGYEGNRVEEFEQKIHQQHGSFKVSKPTLDSGDVLIFNGLTFHRTFSSESMKTHRDALLIRVIKPKHHINFPSDNNLIVNFK